jgi:hypothetical protein
MFIFLGLGFSRFGRAKRQCAAHHLIRLIDRQNVAPRPSPHLYCRPVCVHSAKNPR